MTLHVFPVSPKSAYRPVVEPDLDARQFKSAVLEPDGPDMCVHALMSAFDAMNPTSGAEARRRAAAVRQPELGRESRRETRHLRRTKPTRTITSSKPQANSPVFSIIEALTMVVGAGLALYLSNLVLANYVVQSGNDLYASDYPGARMFAMLAVLAALGVKAFEKRLTTDAARYWYATVFYTIGLASFLVWAVTGALLFAPKSGGTSWLTESTAGPWVPVALMLAHVLGDCALGYILFSGAELLLLGNRERIVLVNPEHAFAQERARLAQAALLACLDEIAEADSYLQAVAQCRLKLQAKAELELDRMTALWRESQATAVAYARAAFLNSSDDR